MATYSYSQLEGLWIQAGGPKPLAPIMAAIAMAESGGNPSAQNPSGATGLWQILGNPFPGNALDPATNAQMAVAKYHSQGLGAWTTYTSGAYKQFLQGGVAPNTNTNISTTAATGGWGAITGFFSSAGTAIDWLVQPNKQIRILAFILGTGALLLGVTVLGLVEGL